MDSFFSKCFFSVALLGLVACDEVPIINSDTLGTGQIYVDMHVTTVGDGYAVVEMQMRKGSSTGTYINLAGNDELVASTKVIDEKPSGGLFDALKEVSENSKQLKEGSKTVSTIWGDLNIGGPWYVTSFGGVKASTTFYVSLERDFDGGAKNSSVTLPPKVKITAPSSTDNFSRSIDGIPVTWEVSTPQYAMAVRANVACVNGDVDEWETTFTDDPGTATIPANTFGSLSGDCSVRILVERTKQGTLNSKFAGGQIRSHSQSSVIVQTTD